MSSFKDVISIRYQVICRREQAAACFFTDLHATQIETSEMGKTLLICNVLKAKESFLKLESSVSVIYDSPPQKNRGIF